MTLSSTALGVPFVTPLVENVFFLKQAMTRFVAASLVGRARAVTKTMTSASSWTPSHALFLEGIASTVLPMTGCMLAVAIPAQAIGAMAPPSTSLVLQNVPMSPNATSHLVLPTPCAITPSVPTTALAILPSLVMGLRLVN